ncbi:MAG TPA: serine/threonine-protein kinase [Kofleriaceae bacterium]
MSCPDTDELAALLAHALDAERRAAIVDHAADCAVCHAVVAELAGSRATGAIGATGATGSGGPHRATRDDSLVEAVRRSVAPSLTGSQGARIGRYQLLELVGAGGMGVVWGAWDPELARRVALKLVHPRLAAARDRILAEGQALGKLSHPNVVPIYDVGVVEEQVYLVMEWVQGTTLRAYAAGPCSRRDLIDAYRQAGEGLAAAHRAGVVHRDFKPDNAIRGDDGRVRVLDFGLARTGDDAPGAALRVSGTPRYMPPEQATGATVTPAADQYAFAISLREALTRPPRAIPDAVPGGRPAELPRWIAAIVARATAPDPAGRFASMAELLRALGRDPARVWSRRAIAAIAVAGIAVAFAAGRAQDAAAPPCTGSTAEIARSWSPGARAAMTAHLRTLGAFGAGEADRLGDELDRYRTAWADEHRRACLAHVRGELPAVLHERRIACLARGQAALTAVAELMTTVPADGLAPALIAARSLPSTAGCAAADTGAVPPPPDAVAAQVAAAAPAIERARVLAFAERGDAAAIAAASVTAAERTGYAPLIARGLVALGWAQARLDVGEPASRASLERAVDLALRGADDVLAVEAYARLTWAVSRYRGDVVGNWPVMEALAARTGAAGRFGRTLLYNNKAAARLAEGDRAGARALLRQALAASPPGTIAEGEIELVSVLQSLAVTADDPADREIRARQVVAQLDAVLGPNHPSTLEARVVEATLTRNPVAAAAAYRAACDGYQRWHPDRIRPLADCAFERGWLADEQGDTALARAAMQLAAADPLSPRERGMGTIAASYLAITGAGDRDVLAATTAMQRLAAAGAGATEWWGRGAAAQAYIAAALGWQRLGKPGDAERCWAAALALLEDLHQPMYDRPLARVRASLARRWAQVRPAEARRLAGEALAWYRAAGGYDTAVAELAPIAAGR